MGLRFYRRVRLFPGVSVNLSRSGPSLSVGVRGAHVTVGRRGVTRTVGIPGSGVFYTSRQGYHTGYHSVASAATSPRATNVTPPASTHVGRGRAGLVLLLIAILLGLVALLVR